MEQKFPDHPLHKLFRDQMINLKLLNCPENILEGLWSKKDKVLDTMTKAKTADIRIPFLPVIPQYCLDLYRLMSMIQTGGQYGYTILNPSQIKSEIKAPNEPYFIFNIGGGESLVGKSTKKRWRTIKQHPLENHLRVAEAIALCIHTGVLQKHEVDCTGSFYGNSGVLPSLYLNQNKAKLGWKVFELPSVWHEPFHCQGRI